MMINDKYAKRGGKRPANTAIFAACLCAAVLLVLFLIYSKDGGAAGAAVLGLASGTSSPVALVTGAPCAAGAAGPPEGDCTVTTKYIPSQLEQSWLDNVATWQGDYCNKANTTEQKALVAAWTGALQSELEQFERKEPLQGMFDPKVFSRFVTTTQCRGQPKHEQVTYIEPLSHGLRHPQAHCNMGAYFMDMNYLLLSYESDVAKARAAAGQRCGNRDCQVIYFDLGATRWLANPSAYDKAGQHWFYNAFKRHGLEFDRMLMWEARPQDPPTVVYSELPHDLIHKYQYFNMPATTNMSDPAHPVRILKTIAHPGDFVVFKHDIDNWLVEYAILKELMADPSAFNLVDEFFFEFHVTFEPMMWIWKDQADPEKSLQDAYKLFYELRQRGWRAHSWV